PSFGLVTRTDTLSSKRDALRRFASVVSSAWTYILASHDHAVEAGRATLARRPTSPLPLNIMVGQMEAYSPYFFTKATANMAIGPQADADWEVAIKNMEAAKVIPAGSRPADYYTNDLVDVAYGKKIVGLQ